MKTLNELLKEYVEKSNYTIYSLSYVSKVNRTTLQRALSGERPISQDNLNKLLPYLNLTLAEKKELDKAFLISQIGEVTFQKHMYIKDLLENINMVGDSLFTEAGMPFSAIDAPIQDVHVIKGLFNLIKITCQIVSYNVTHERRPFLYTVSHFQNRFFGDLYEQLQVPYYSTLDIRHIVPFVKTSRDNTEDSLFNLQVLSTLFPFALTNSSNCSLYYYYERSNSSRMEGIPFPYYMICNRNVILIASDCETALLLPEAAVSHYLHRFQLLLHSARPLLEAVDTSSILSMFISSARSAVSSYSLEKQPCLTAFVDSKIIQNSINEELPKEQQQFLTATLLNQCDSLKKLTDIFSVFSKDGLDDFVKFGSIDQIPNALYHPVSIPDRITMLTRMIQANQAGSFQFYMMKSEAFSPRMELFTYDNASIMFTCGSPESGETRACVLKEPNIIESFNDFLRNLTGHDLVYSREETSAFFEQSIQYLQQFLPPSRTSVLIDEDQK